MLEQTKLDTFFASQFLSDQRILVSIVFTNRLAKTKEPGAKKGAGVPNEILAGYFFFSLQIFRVGRINKVNYLHFHKIY